MCLLDGTREGSRLTIYTSSYVHSRPRSTPVTVRKTEKHTHTDEIPNAQLKSKIMNPFFIRICEEEVGKLRRRPTQRPPF